MKSVKSSFIITAIFFGVAFTLLRGFETNNPPVASFDGAYPESSRVVVPNWAAIASWPNLDAPTVDAQPDPNRRITALILDDSGSMGSDIRAAKAAMIEALAAMDKEDRVAVIALNNGVVLPFTTVGDARTILSAAIRPITSDGKTPLTPAVKLARGLLEKEAAYAQSFGTYRIIVTTDGQANRGNALVAAIEAIAKETPIQVTTIGIGIGRQHVLSSSDLGSFVDIADVSALGTALQKAVAENTNFAAISEFSEGN